MSSNSGRRQLLGLAGAAALAASLPRIRPAQAAEKDDVEAAEDLMREHGVLRRALLVYSEAASRLSRGDDVPADALRQTATLFRTFGEDYHERSLEEPHVFPPLMKLGGKNGRLASVLKQQHDRGREITDYVSTITRSGHIAKANDAPLSTALLTFVRMYQHHTAIEDTVIFPAWKEAISKAQYRELSEQFEDLEHRMFGKDGFEDAVKRISTVEQVFGLGDLSKLTAPAPPPPAA